MISVKLSISYNRQSAQEGSVKALREVSLSVEKGRSPGGESGAAKAPSSWRFRACFRRERR
ncbi:hypothetical protein MASR2M17_23780 [Aminivibrio sp.]